MDIKQLWLTIKREIIKFSIARKEAKALNDVADVYKRMNEALNKDNARLKKDLFKRKFFNE